MKPRWQKQRNRALTLPEMLVVIAIIVILFFLLLPVLVREKPYSQGINCVSNLKQVNLSFRIWEGDNNNKYPMAVSVTNGGAMEQIATGDVVDCFLVMSNELSTPKILICPADRERVPATNFWGDFNASHISYFVGVDGDEVHPQRLLSGDDNFQINNAAVPSGMLSAQTNAPVSWTTARHRFVGNIGLSDGSVWEVSIDGLRQALQKTGLATNRLAIP